jgi:hypothetical protein
MAASLYVLREFLDRFKEMSSARRIRYGMFIHYQAMPSFSCSSSRPDARFWPGLTRACLIPAPTRAELRPPNDGLLTFDRLQGKETAHAG